MKKTITLQNLRFSKRAAYILAVFFLLQLAVTNTTYGQCQPYIKIDGNLLIANQNPSTGLSLPIWLRAGQTVAIDQVVNSISVIEFTISGTTLEFSQVLSITSTSPQSVPSGKVWKVESVLRQPSTGTNNSVAYTTPGTYTFTVPSCASYICAEVWGAGGGGGSASSTSTNGAGGGGGAYGQQCLSVSPGSSLSITVGAGGAGSNGGGGDGNAGGSSSVGSISAGGGSGGQGSGTGGAGGTSNATVNITGGTGYNQAGTANCQAGVGANGANGGAGGNTGNCNSTAGNGTAPGGGGGGGPHNGGSLYGGVPVRRDK